MAMIPQNIIQEILETARVEEVIGEYVNLKKRGANLLGLCPFHNEKTPSFTVSPAKNFYKCFGCGRGGTVVQFVMEHESVSFPEAIRILAKKYNIEIEEKELSPEERQQLQVQDSLLIVNEFAKGLYQKNLFDTALGKTIALPYFIERGFRQSTLEKFGLGFAIDKKDDLTLKAVQAGYNVDLLKRLGLSNDHGRDFFRNRVMFPIFNLGGKVVAFAGRIMGNNPKAPKYINSPETEIYHKSHTLYALNFAKYSIRGKDECILVEGYTDVISLHQNGIENVVASSGTSLTPGQIRLVKRYTDNITMLYDGDPAGIKAALRGLDLVLEQGMNVRIVMLPEKEDPDSFISKVGSTEFEQYLKDNSNDFIIFKTNLLSEELGDDPVKKAALIQQIVESISKVRDPIKRSLYLQRCAELMQIDEQLLVNAVNQDIRKEIKKRRQKESRNVIREDDRILREQIEQNAWDKPEINAPVHTDEFQERDIIRILVNLGHLHYDDEQKFTVSDYLLKNLEDVLDKLENPIYQQIITFYLSPGMEDKIIDTNFFLSHPDDNIRNLAVELISDPYTYSSNWFDKWGITLQTQKMPDENFIKDCHQAILRFKLRKINKMADENYKLILQLSKEDKKEELALQLKVHIQLNKTRNQIASELRTIVL